MSQPQNNYACNKLFWEFEIPKMVYFPTVHSHEYLIGLFELCMTDIHSPETKKLFRCLKTLGFTRGASQKRQEERDGFSQLIFSKVYDGILEESVSLWIPKNVNAELRPDSRASFRFIDIQKLIRHTREIARIKREADRAVKAYERTDESELTGGPLFERQNKLIDQFHALYDRFPEFDSRVFLHNNVNNQRYALNGIICSAVEARHYLEYVRFYGLHYEIFAGGKRLGAGRNPELRKTRTFWARKKDAVWAAAREAKKRPEEVADIAAEFCLADVDRNIVWHTELDKFVHGRLPAKAWAGKMVAQIRKKRSKD